MRIANLEGRLALVVDEGRAVDVATASGGLFGPDPQSVYSRWAQFREWAAAVSPEDALPFVREQLHNPVPAPRQVLAIGLNYVAHAEESRLDVPERPVVFTKFASCLTGPQGEITLPKGNVDWEVELVVVMGAVARDVPRERAWHHVAGLTVGQDLSERVGQLAGPAPQFSLGKSHQGFGPLGPVVVTPDEFDDPDDLELGCVVNGEQVQKARTSEMIFAVDDLISRLSAVITLLPGDVIFTGTPAGVGLGRSPQRYLAPNDILTSYVRGIGEMRHTFV